MAAPMASCRTTDHVDVALVAMKENGIRLVAIVDASDRVRGLIAIDDLIRRTGPDAHEIAGEAVLDVLRHICEAEAPVTAPAGPA